jgi:predicted nucleic acid-binding protein
MAYLLDTNVVSEAASRNPDPKVRAWCEKHAADSYLSCVTLGEIRKGLHLMPRGARRDALEAWVSQLCKELPKPCLPVDAAVMETWGELYAKNQAAGLELDVLDSLIAATAIHHHLVVVTWNTADFPPEVKTINPWLA